MTKREARKYTSIAKKINKIHKEIRTLCRMLDVSDDSSLDSIRKEIRHKLGDADYEIWKARRAATRPLILDLSHGYSYSELQQMIAARSWFNCRAR